MIFRLIPLLLAARRELWKVHRRDRGRAFVLTTTLMALFDLVLSVTAVMAVAFLVAIGAPLAAAILVGLVGWLVLPHWLVEHVAIRLGWYRAAWWLARFDPRGDRARWPWLCAARAIARRGAPQPALDWLFGRPARLDGTQLAVHGFIAHGRGDREGARVLLRSLADVADPAPEARALAGEWLALDAAERGAWRDLLDTARSLARPGRGKHRAPAAIARLRDGEVGGPAEPLWPATPMSFLLEGVAGRLLDRADAPSQVGLWFRWLLAPRRRATLPLVRAALAPRGPAARAAPAPAPGPAVVTATEPGPALAIVRPPDPRTAAVAAHAQAVRAPSRLAATEAVAAWSQVVDAPGWTQAQIERALALGVPPDLAAAAATAVRDALIGALVELAIASRATALDGSPLGTTVATRARARILDGLELSLARAHDRIAARQALSALDEWRAFLALRAAYLDVAAAGDVQLERVAFPHAEDAFGAWAVWLWNVRDEHVASHAISAWLYERALVVGDSAAIELHGKNGSLTIPGL